MAPDLILTAAHCADALTTVVVGTYNLSDLSGSVQTFGIATKHIHNNYNRFTSENDVMLIELDGNITGVGPIRVNNNISLPIATDNLAVVGWGAIDVSGRKPLYPDILQEVELRYVPNIFCRRISA